MGGCFDKVLKPSNGVAGNVMTSVDHDFRPVHFSALYQLNVSSRTLELLGLVFSVSGVQIEEQRLLFYLCILWHERWIRVPQMYTHISHITLFLATYLPFSHPIFPSPLSHSTHIPPTVITFRTPFFILHHFVFSSPPAFVISPSANHAHITCHHPYSVQSEEGF